MKVAFYAPLKSPSHPVPSGDRLMARLWMKALEELGHEAEEISGFRSYLPNDHQEPFRVAQREAEREIERISAQWRQSGPPGLWFTYHPYYKSPDFLGPELCRAFSIPYITAEASYSRRRNTGAWAISQAVLLEGIRQAVVNLCLTCRDQEGLARVASAARFARISPFIDTTAFIDVAAAAAGRRLITIAMMRSGDKFDSFRMLSAALSLLKDSQWTLTIVGGGPLRREVEQLFADIAPERLEYLGEVSPQAVPALLARSSIYVWPGCGEAYGLAYLEAQAAGIPVVAQNTAGVPEVVKNGRTGILTPEGDVPAFAAAIQHLLSDERAREEMGAEARRLTLAKHSLVQAVARLSKVLEHVT
jgi:glycosyltransferase involved in cell wall biosynthesis